MPRLTAHELDCVIAVANNAEAWETFKDFHESEDAVRRDYDAYERGMEKLKTMLAAREATQERRRRRGG